MASPRRSRDPVQEAAVGEQLYANWGLLALAGGPEGLPLVESVQKGRVDAVEYGRGYFGVVMPTSVPGVVFKLTTDPAEAFFAQIVLATRDAAPGLVRYYRVAALAGRHGPKRDLRVFALWREEATGVGKAVGSNSVWRRFLQPAAVRREQGFAGRLDEFFVYARMVEGFVEKDLRGDARALAAVLRGAAALRGRVDPDAIEGERMLDDAVRAAGPDAVARAAFALAMAEEVAMRMSREPYGELVGAALHHYARAGIVLADVHEGNVGFVERPGHGGRALVITDPGRAVVLTERYRGLRIPELAALAGRAGPAAAPASPARRGSARPRASGEGADAVRPNPSTARPALDVWPVRCTKCGRAHSERDWDALPLLDVWRAGGWTTELRNCPCRGTMAVEWEEPRANPTRRRRRAR